MGLDNGIIVQGKNKNVKSMLKERYAYLEESYNPGEYEFGYWRKSWNIRQRFLDVLYFKEQEQEHSGIILLSIEDIPVIVNKVLKYFLVESNWEYRDCSSTAFTWIEQLPSIARSIYDLSSLYEDIKNKGITDDEIEIYFYDSY